MYYGAAYYPEHWPEERWALDAQMMQAAGFNVVRMGEFAWTRFEPKEGVYDFSWLDRAIAILSAHGIQSILGTPTAAPPKWLVDRHPDIFPVDFKGHAKGYGHRRYYCYNNHNFRHHVQAITERMAERYADNPDVIGWQIDNELGCVDTVRCFCDNCRKEFQIWLRKKYGTIDALNEQWGTVFSNQIYGSFDEVILPTYGPINLHNPGLELDFRRFSSDSVIKFQRLQADILHTQAPNQKVTTNMMQSFTQIDYFKLAADLDLVGFDIYPNNSKVYPPDFSETAFEYDQIRGVAQNKNYWVLEMQSGTPGGNVMRKSPKPGELQRWTWQAIAHGADAMVYFRWRTCVFGLEEFWHGILDHNGLPNRRYEEVKQIGHKLKILKDRLEGSQVHASVAMVYSYDNDWTFEIQPQVKDYRYRQQFLRYYTVLHRQHIPVDIVGMDADLSQYQLVILPNMIMAEPAFAGAVSDYVRQGGCVVMDYRAGAKLWNNQMNTALLPGYFRNVLGITVDEYGVLSPDERLTLVHQPTETQYEGDTWYDVVHPEEASTLVTYGSDYMAGQAAVTRNHYENGTAYYLGTGLPADLLSVLLDDICQAQDIRPIIPCRLEGIEMVRRTKGDMDLIFIINHNPMSVSLDLDKPYLNALTTVVVNGLVEIPANGELILQSL